MNSVAAAANRWRRDRCSDCPRSTEASASHDILAPELHRWGDLAAVDDEVGAGVLNLLAAGSRGSVPLVVRTATSQIAVERVGTVVGVDRALPAGGQPGDGPELIAGEQQLGGAARARAAASAAAIKAATDYHAFESL